MQGRRTRAAVTLLVAMLYIVAGCTALAPERQPEATHSATPSPIELERATEDYIANGSVALRTINSVIVEVDGIRQLELYRNGGGPNHYSHLWSVTKSVVSTLVGIAIAEGKISSLMRPCPSCFPTMPPRCPLTSGRSPCGSCSPCPPDSLTRWAVPNSATLRSRRSWSCRLRLLREPDSSTPIPERSWCRRS